SGSQAASADWVRAQGFRRAKERSVRRYVSTGAQPRHRQKPGSAGVAPAQFLAVVLARLQGTDEGADGLDHVRVHLRLSRLLRRESRLVELERVVAAVDDVKLVASAHPSTHSSQEIQRTELVARALHEQDGAAHSQQHLIAQWGPWVHADERVA